MLVTLMPSPSFPPEISNNFSLRNTLVHVCCPLLSNHALKQWYFFVQFCFVFPSLFTGIREAENNPFQTSQTLCMQIPFCSKKEAQTPAEVHLTCPCGLQLLPIITLGINSLSWLWSVDRNVGASIVIFSPAFFTCFPHFVEIWAQKFLEAPSLS